MPGLVTLNWPVLRFSLIRSGWLFGSTVFLAAFLLFLVEPIAARQLLPIFGGSAAVWITCLVFFQAALLCAYLYAHWLSLRPKWPVHLALLTVAAAWLILVKVKTFGGAGFAGLGQAGLGQAGLGQAGLDQAFQGGSHPVFSIFLLLGISIGLPFLMLGATSPLLQVWMARVSNRSIPYRLYALSNLASLLALGLYPIWIEPNFTLRQQWLGWCTGFAIFAVLSMVLTWQVRSFSAHPVGAAMRLDTLLDTPLGRAGSAPIQTGTESSADALAPLPLPSPVSHKLLWVLLPMGAAMQLSAVSSHLTQNIAAIPLLWILPLAVYLITLIVAFQFRRPLPRWLGTRLLVVLLAGLGYMLTQTDSSLPLKVSLGFFLAELFVACLVCHTEAYALRPQLASETTLFYLLFAAGGALGSFLTGIASPLIFSYNYDLAISFFVTAALAFAVNWASGWGQRLLWATTSVLMLMLVFFLRTAFHRDTQVAVRNFYGSLRVKQSIGYPPALVRTLANGTIQHGSQVFSAELLKTPTTYYAEDSGVGLALRFCCQGRARKIGVIGLGVGTIAAYGQAGDTIRFYEINPAVIPIAREVFAYIRNSPANISIVEGDARTSLAQEEAQQFDVLVIDAFSGDAIPLHLLTSEAVELYQRHLAAGGILAFHISNQHVDLEPEIARLAEFAKMQAVRVSTPINLERHEFAASWMLVTSNRPFLARPEVTGAARAAVLNPKVRLWTDDYSSLMPVLRW